MDSLSKLFRVNNENGFSLLEMAIVLAVAGILSSAAMKAPINRSLRLEGRKNAADIKLIQDYAKMFYADYQAFPVDMNTLAADYPHVPRTNSRGKPYLINLVDNELEVQTDIYKRTEGFMEKVLPGFTNLGTSGDYVTVSTVVPKPGYESSLDAFGEAYVKKNGDTMTGELYVRRSLDGYTTTVLPYGMEARDQNGSSVPLYFNHGGGDVYVGYNGTTHMNDVSGNVIEGNNITAANDIRAPIILRYR